MTLINLPGGVVEVAPDRAEQVSALLRARYEFSMEYCRLKGWPEDAGKLTLQQIIEIRNQPRWANPL